VPHVNLSQCLPHLAARPTATPSSSTSRRGALSLRQGLRVAEAVAAMPAEAVALLRRWRLCLHTTAPGPEHRSWGEAAISNSRRVSRNGKQAAAAALPCSRSQKSQPPVVRNTASGPWFRQRNCGTPGNASTFGSVPSPGSAGLCRCTPRLRTAPAGKLSFLIGACARHRAWRNEGIAARHRADRAPTHYTPAVLQHPAHLHTRGRVARSQAAVTPLPSSKQCASQPLWQHGAFRLL